MCPPEPLSFVIDPDVVAAFLAATGDPNRYDPDQGASAPSMLAAVYLVELIKARGAPPGGVHAKQAIRFHRAPVIGETLVLTARVVEKYSRNERPYVVTDFEARSGADMVATGRMTAIWGKDQ